MRHKKGSENMAREDIVELQKKVDELEHFLKYEMPADTLLGRLSVKFTIREYKRKIAKLMAELE